MHQVVEDAIFGVCFLITLVLVGIFVYHRVKSMIEDRKHKKVIEEIETEKEKEIDKSKSIRLYDLRQFKYNGFENFQNDKYRAFFIDEGENEAFNIFVTVAPSIFNTLTKLERTQIDLEKELDVNNEDESVIHDKLRLVNDSLTALKHATDQLSDKLVEIYEKSSTESCEKELDEEIVNFYINVVNNMVAFAFDYLSAANIIRYKVRELHPHLERDFIIGTEQFLRIFFVDLMNCINMLDKSIEAYK